MKKNNKFKIAVFAAVMLFAGAVNAQVTTATATDFTRQSNGDIALGTSGGSVKVIDNKGTKKYLQSANGITMFTDTAPNGGVVTTWQLGGTLDVDTTISTGSQTFTIDGEEFLLSDVAITSGSSTVASDSSTIGTSGYTVLVRDESDGQIQKILLTDLLKVEAIRQVYDQSGDASADVPITVTGLPVLDADTSAGKLFVYRNGVKLRFGTDFTSAVDLITITYSAVDLPMYDEDVIEIQYVK